MSFTHASAYSLLTDGLSCGERRSVVTGGASYSRWCGFSSKQQYACICRCLWQRQIKPVITRGGRILRCRIW